MNKHLLWMWTAIRPLVLTMVFCSLTTTSAWAQDIASEDSIADEVELRDGTVVKARRVPKQAPSSDYTYTYKGVKYTYITESNYTRFFNLSVHKPKDYGWYADDDGWFVNAEKAYITAASIDEESVPANGEVAILNDLVGFFTSHTHLGCIADHGFTGESKVKRIYFKDCDSWAYSANSKFYFFIGHLAFANAPQLEKVDLIRFLSNDQWGVLDLNNVPRIWDNFLEGSPNALIRVGSYYLQQFRNSSVWAAVKDRIISYEPSGYEMIEYGASYKCMKSDGESYLDNSPGWLDYILRQLRPWNADYQNFNARQLLADNSEATIYYTTIEGADPNYLKSHDGVLRIYNDIGSYYNYKTLAVRRGAFTGCDELKAVEFYQTNGRSENSYSDLKMVIENGAFRGCKNLKEIRMYYYIQDGDDHWETLGPEDVIPGDDIFGWKADFDEVIGNIDIENYEWEVPQVHIIVSPTRYMEFVNDPNWSRYRKYIVPADYEPSSWNAVNEGGLTYDYASKTPNAASTSQVVTVEASWWNVPIIVAEIVITYLTAGTGKAGSSAAATATSEATKLGTEITALNNQKLVLDGAIETVKQLTSMDGIARLAAAAKQGTSLTNLLGGSAFKQAMGPSGLNAMYNILGNRGFSNEIVREGLYDLFKNAVITVAKNRISEITSEIATKELLQKTLLMQASQALLKSKLAIARSIGANSGVLAAFNGAHMVGQFQPFSGQVNEDQMKNGLADNMVANIHQVGMVGFGITTPDKKLIYHTYIKEADPNQTDFTIYNDIGSVYNYRTVGVSRYAFQGNTTVQRIKFAESRSSRFDSYASLLFTIPDSAFAGCTGLREFDLRYQTARGGETALGPENFILCGDSIFAGCDSTQLRIIVGEERLQDFLDNPSWAKYSRYLTTGTLAEKQATSGYGVKYAYSYLENTTRHITYGMGHEIEHLYAYEADNSFLDGNSGALGLFNDVGNWNNYHLDYVKKGAFRDNQKLKEVSFWNINGFSIWGEAYADIDITLQDESFKNCQNLESLGLVYLSHATTTRGSVKPLTPQTLRLGDRVFEGTPKLRLKMMPTQVEAFLADSAWASYKDKFAPCLFKPVDGKVKSMLSDLRYTLHCSTMNNSWDIIDALQLKEKGFSWLNGKFAKSAIEEFPEFKIFEAAGLDYVGGSWFLSCENLRNIEIPSTVKHIGGWAFYGCKNLKEITIPTSVETIDACAFQYSGLKTVRCEGTKPAKLDYSVFDLSNYDGFTIYVPAEAVDAYKTAWPSYAQYIVSDAERPVIHYVKTTKVGELAEKLGLQTIMDGNYLTGLIGQYQQFDSLVVEGPLNGLDVGVLRFLGGANVNNSEPTLGRLRYLNLYGAELKKDAEHPYQCWGSNDYLEEDDMVGDFMFTYCDKLRTLILPRTAKKIGENVFEETHGLKHLAVGDETVEADNELFEDNKAPLEELVFLGNVCTSDDKTCWEPGAEAVYVKGNKVGQFLGRNDITSSCQLVVAAFKDSEAMDAFTRKGLFFPSEYRQLTSIDGILNDRVKSFDEFEHFENITDLGSAFNGCKALERVTLPDSLRHMGYSAFQGCNKLRSITISADSVPTLEEGAFRDLPSDFRIYVPKTHTKRYRDAWPEYADHIAGNNINIDDVIVVNVYKANQLGEALGLKVHTKKIYVKKDDNGKEIDHRGIQVIGVEGDYNRITKLKVNGLISGGDLALLRYLAGYCPWSDKPNLAGRLEYIDLYDTQLVSSEWHFAQDKLTTRSDYVWENDVLPAYAFLQCYQLKTLILPKGLKEIRSRSIMQCESLENVVVGDSIQILNWDAFDDDVSLTRMYLLAKNKPEMDADNWVWRNLCNNYNPTFDAFYVRPSLYNQYISDDDYVGNSWQRTNNISTGIFTDDATFTSFAAHAAATEDDLSDVTSVNGWFKEHPGITDLTPLSYTLVETLRTEDMQPLTQLERIAMPMLLTQVGDGAFSNAKKLRYADFQLSDSLDLMNNLKDGGLQRIGLTDRTLCYMPAQYGETDEVNVAVGSGTSGFRAKNFRLYDDADYCVPIAFTANNVENTRILAKSAAPYTVCLPYALEVPANAKVYRLSGRSGNELIFAQHTERMEALQPYLVWAEQGDASLNTSGEVSIPVSGGTTYGRQQQSPSFVMRGTLDAISNQEAVDLGAYVMNDDAKWHPVLSDTEAHKAVTIPAFRCYLLQSRYNSRVAIGMTLEDAEGIEQLRTIDADGTERVYDLSGRRIDGNVRGLVIKNGRKIIKY